MKPTAHIYDVDGTLANVDPFLHYVRNGNKDYDSFHYSSIDALPNVEVVEMLNNSASDDHSIIIVTSRKEKYRGITSLWLARNKITCHALFMRADDDNRPDYEAKKDMLDKINKHWLVIHAVDDNPNVIKLWQDHGIPITKIGTWDGNKS